MLIGEESSTLEMLSEPPTERVLKYHDGTEKIETINIFRGVVHSSHFRRDTKVVKVSRCNQYLVDLMLRRFRSSAKKFKNVLLPIQCFMDEEFMYFCYEYFEDDIHSLCERGNYISLRRACRGFIKGLLDLHRHGKAHGHIVGFNLVVSKGNGYLAGGIGNPVASSYGPSGNQVVVDPVKWDIIGLVDALRSCLNPQHSNLSLFVNYLEDFLTLRRIKHHPYVSNALGEHNFFVSVKNDFDAIHPRILIGVFKNVRKNTGHAFANWHNEVNHATLVDVFNYSWYGTDDVSKFFFFRNVWVHGKKREMDTVIQHCERIHRLLESRWPGFSSLAYYVACERYTNRRILL